MTRKIMMALAIIIGVLAVSTVADAAGGRCPNTTNGRATVAAIHRYFPKAQWATAERIAYRETGCAMPSRSYNCGFLCVYRPSSGDHSAGPFMVNFRGGNARTLASWGVFLRATSSINGGVRAASVMFNKCHGWGPWTRPYTCRL